METTFDKARFETELQAVLGPAYGYALRLVSGDRDEASDLLQEASLAAFRGRETFTPGTHFKAWFFKILTNQFYRRGSKRHVDTINLDDDPEPYLYIQARRSGVPAEADPSSLLFDKFDGETVLLAMDELPDDYRVASSMYFVSEMSYEEIATALDVPIGTVRSRLHRGRKLLQTKLWDVAKERGLVGGEPVG